MNVSLTPELEKFVTDKVRSGLYQTASEVVREALRLLKVRDDEARRADEMPVEGNGGGSADPKSRGGGTRQRVRR
ncbi:MAG TPA: type II toxin-antitoxin system ParD family antitoxin [Vicinamibacterales bacterium]|jgi:putative addiction module CopG family antidote